MKNLQQNTLGIRVINGVEGLYKIRILKFIKENTPLEKGFYRRVSLLGFFLWESVFMFERLELLIGNKIESLHSKTVLIIGLGGVGGYALECIVRSGIGRVIIVDNDVVDITNLNRQIVSLHSNIGQLKVDAWEKRIKDINPDIEVTKIKQFITKDNISLLFENKIDYLIDACDTVETKKEIIRNCLNRNIKFISSMGTGNKLDITKFKIEDIRKTSYDPIAKIIRKMVKEERIKGKIPVIYSTESPIKTNSKTIASISFVPAMSGLMCASFVINDIIGDINGRRN